MTFWDFCDKHFAALSTLAWVVVALATGRAMIWLAEYLTGGRKQSGE